MKRSLVCYGRMFHKMHLQSKGLGLTRYSYNANVAVDIGTFLWHTEVLRRHRDRKWTQRDTQEFSSMNDALWPHVFPLDSVWPHVQPWKCFCMAFLNLCQSKHRQWSRTPAAGITAFRAKPAVIGLCPCLRGLTPPSVLTCPFSVLQ